MLAGAENDISTLVEETPRRCRLFASLAADDLEPATAEDESFWVTAEAKRGRLCDVCACLDAVANCSGRGLATVPVGSDVRVLDLSDNPGLVVLGGGLAKTGELYAGLEAAVDAATLPATRGKCEIVRSELGGDCAAMGAAWLVFAEGA